MNTPDTANLALFCDFENVALGVRDARYAQFDISKVLERLLLKGSIVVKKAYCDWERYKEFKAAMHDASFELIEIPHVRQSGKNSADIRMVVDALDLCYTKAHVDTFVIISGDSDFSPLVSKLRENNKTVIGVGVKNSTSDLLIANCDEFIYYDDLVREQKTRSAPRRKSEGRAAAGAAAKGAARSRAPGRQNPRPRPRRRRRRRPSTSFARPTTRWCPNGVPKRRSGAPWSSRRLSAASRASARATTASALSTSCSRRRRPATSWCSSATRSRAATSSGPYRIDSRNTYGETECSSC